MGVWEILFQIMGGYWSRRYTDKLSEKRESYTKIFFTVWFWLSLISFLPLILNGDFKISLLPKFLAFGAIFAIGSVMFMFIYFYAIDYTKEHNRKKKLPLNTRS